MGNMNKIILNHNETCLFQQPFASNTLLFERNTSLFNKTTFSQGASVGVGNKAWYSHKARLKFKFTNRKEWWTAFPFHTEQWKTTQLPTAEVSEVKTIKQHSGLQFLFLVIHSLSFLIALWSVNIWFAPQVPEDAWEKEIEQAGKTEVQSSLNTIWFHVFTFSWQTLDFGILSSWSV